LNDPTIIPNDIEGDPDFLPDDAAFYDDINSKCLYGCGSRYSLNFSSWGKPFAGADLVQLDW